ncbi:MAG: hypothetical protein IT318_17185, partial [Anaerolineales bacterium]|nr:hypothetical protein [Anaerolineales bacterium]
MPAIWPPPLRQWAGRLWPYLIISLAAAVAAAPLANASLPCSDDAAFHLYRAVELGRLLELGHWLPRWAPDMALGYGYPFYNFYAPLSSYVVVALHGAARLAYPAALKAAFALGLWLAGLSAFWLVRALWGPRAGVAAGVTYTLAPYLAYDVLFRGNLAEAFAFVWPPLALLGLEAAVQAGPGSQPLSRARVRAALLAALAYAALILTHNVFALIASPLLGGYVALRAWQARSWRGLLLGALSLALGIGLAAYFWLPAMVERAWVQSDRLLVPPIFTWHTNFISSGELLALPRPDDPALINPSPARGVGAATALLCLPALLAGLGAARARDRQRAGLIAFFALALGGYALLTLPVSAPVWRLVKPLELAQFPWRMLGPAALCSAVLIGAGVAAMEAPFSRAGSRLARLSALPLAAVSAIVFFTSLPAWYPRYCAAPATAGVAELIGYEIATNTIGTTAKGEYLPRTAPGVPAGRAVAQALMSGQTPMRLALPAEAGTITSAAPRDPLDATYQVDVSRPATAVYQQFLYPGWVIEVDGRPVAARPVPEGQAQAGLIEFALPAGSRVVRARFGSTPLRAGASLISGLAVTAWLAVGLWPRPRLGQTPPARGTADGGRAGAGLVGVFAALVLVKFALIDRLPNPLRRPGLDQRV